jgi:hypothetical protein
VARRAIDRARRFTAGAVRVLPRRVRAELQRALATGDAAASGNTYERLYDAQGRAMRLVGAGDFDLIGRKELGCCDGAPAATDPSSTRLRERLACASPHIRQALRGRRHRRRVEPRASSARGIRAAVPGDVAAAATTRSSCPTRAWTPIPFGLHARSTARSLS